MKRSVFFTIGVALVLISLGGCVLDSASTRSKKASATADMSSLQNDLRRLQTEVELLQDRMDRFTQEVSDDVADMKATVRDLESRSAHMKTDIIKDVNTKITALENRRIKVTNALNSRIDTVLREVTSMLRKGGGTTQVTSGSEKGFYYTVEAGDSPWKIAQKYKGKYGVTTQDILDANGLGENDSIRPGDKLFIPVKQ
jgi:LysM repeat protein